MSERIGRFELLEPLGSGAMGVVWRARDTRLRRDVALKLIREERSSDRTVRERFVREFRTAASLNHPGIATLFEADETPEGQVYCVYEKVDGETLTARIQRGALPTVECIDIGLQLADAIGAAHEAGVIHRDIKPDNVMLTPEGRVKVLDFGLARLEEREPAAQDVNATLDEPLRTRDGALVGTPRYMSPEQASGAEVDARTDVFSTGLVLYELVTGEAAFTGDSVPETLHRIQAEDHRSVNDIDRSVDRRLARVIDRALAKSPGERFSSGGEMALALRKLTHPPARTTWHRWVAAGVLLAAVTAALWFGTRPSLAFSDRDKLLIADVDNRTGEQMFDLALTAAIAHDVEQSRYARVYDRALVAETLTMLRRPPDAVIDEQLGRDICRFAGLRALVVPRILSVGNAYEVQATLVDPISGRHVETLRVTAEGREAVLLEAVDELARRLRRTLGESLSAIEENDLPVSQHTTSSWEALQSLTLGDVRWQQTRPREAAALFQRAIELDPEFMAAHGSLGLLKIQFLEEPEEGKRLLRRALELADDVTDVERLMIRAVNKEFVGGDLEGALTEYEVIVDLYPDYAAALNNKGQLLFRLGRYPEAGEVFRTAHEANPKSSFPLWAMARIEMFVNYDAVAGEATMRKIVELYPESTDALHMLAWAYVGQARFEEAEVEMRRVLEIDSHHVLALPNLAHILLRLGRPAEAVEVYRSLIDGGDPQATKGRITWNTLCLGLALQAAGAVVEAEQLLSDELAAIAGTGPAGGGGIDVFDFMLLEAALGRNDQAAARIDELDPATLSAYQLSQLAQVMALLGRRDEALDTLESAVAAGFQDVFFWSIMPPFAGIRDEPRLLALIGP